MRKRLLFTLFAILFCSTTFGQKPNWEAPNSGAFQGNMTVSAYFKIYGEEQFNQNIEFAAFCGNELRGVGSKPVEVTLDGEKHYLSVMTVHGNANDIIKFKIWDPVLEEVLGTLEEKNFYLNDVVGPIAMDFYQEYWDFTRDVNEIPQSMTIISQIAIDDNVVIRPNLEVAAFHGDELRGIGRYDEIDNNMIYFTIYGNDKETENITFKLYDHNDGTLITESDYSKPFKVDDVLGDYFNPEIINFITASYVAQIGENKYTTFEKAYEAAQDNDDIILLDDITLESTPTVISKDINITLGEYAITGTVELANTGATITGAQNGVTSVITNVADYKVVYEDGMYKLVAKVYVAKVGGVKYETIQEAYAAANETTGIELLSDITLESAWKIEKSINIALNNFTITGTVELANTGATITGAENGVTEVITNVADYKVVYENGVYKLVAKVYVAKVGDVKYEVLTEAYEAANETNGIELLSNITLESTWKIEKSINIALGDFSITGTVELANISATITGAENGVTEVITNVADYKVVYENGVYKLVAKVYVAKVGDIQYEVLSEAYEAANETNGIELLSDITLESTWKIEKSINIALNNFTITGTVELANTGATIAGAENGVTEVITNVADYKVVYDGSMYKLVAKVYVAKVGGVKYEVLTEAYEAANETNGIELLSDITLESTWKIEKSINIALGDFTITGTVELANTGATITGAQDGVTSVTTNVADYKVVYEDGMYKLVAKVYVAKVGDVQYETIQEAYTAANETTGIELLSDITLESTWKIEKPINIALGSFSITGTVELANVGATITGAQNGVTSVITNVADYKVVYDGSMYKLVAKVYVAKVGDVKYESVNEAINSAADGATVQLLPGTISEYIAPWATDTQHTSEKSITIVGAENYGTTLTGGMYLGYDDSQCREHNIVVKGINFTGKGILVAGQKNVVIENNKFSNITDCVADPGSANANAISVIGKNINATVTGNVIDGTASAGINLRDTKTVNVSGNTVTNTVHNSITVQNNTTAEGDIVEIKDNTLSNWGTGGEGRAIRIAGGATVSVNGNVMTKENAPEEFVKVTNATTVDASANYWNGVSPLTDGMFTGVEGDLVPVLVSYYTDAAKTNLVYLSAFVHTLSAGWNWFSSYIDINGTTGLAKLQNALGTNGIQIKGNNSFTDYIGDEEYPWYGSLTSTSVKEMYMIKVKDNHSLQMTGELVDPDQNAITLVHGWNWIGYQLNTELSVSVAIKEPKDGDRIKSHQGFSQYYNNESYVGWWGTLETMTPGYGYMYYNANDNSATLEYSYPADGSKSEVRANITSENNYWVPASSRYAGNMNIVAMLEADGDNYEIAAFVGGEVRGSARPIYVEPLDAYMFFLTVHGEDVEEMSFRVYDLATGEEYNLNDRMNYTDNAIVGSITEPYIFRGTVGVGETSLSEINVYPNPTTTGNEINLGTECDTVEVFNALGVKVAEYQNVDTVDALETAGVYVIRITNNGNVQNCRLIVK